MIDFKEIPHTGDTWELFARDFLLEVGFYIESTPDRGPDGGKDLLVTEQLKGKLNRYRHRWLVSCKHFAKSGVSVKEADEPNILERLSSFDADGFLGFYSTLPSSGLNSRLNSLKKEGKVGDYRIFDHKLIEKYMIRMGYSQILMRYYPESYKLVKPLHELLDDYVPLKCDSCGKDLLEALFREDRQGLIAQVTNTDEDGIKYVKEMYYACKGKCDRKLMESIRSLHKEPTAWKDISDLAIPLEFLRYVIATINRLNEGNFKYSDTAFKKEKEMIISLSQKTMREMTEYEKERVRTLMSIPF